jgi:hypothetical protein
MAPLPLDLQDALNRGELTEPQLRELIAFEAEALGLSFDAAVKAAHAGTLPHGPIGADLELLVDLLPAA